MSEPVGNESGEADAPPLLESACWGAHPAIVAARAVVARAVKSNIDSLLFFTSNTFAFLGLSP